MTDCYGFPHQESIIDGKISVTLDVQMSQAMFSFHRRINKNEQIVGWYATTTPNGPLIPEYSSLINEFYNGQCKAPIHIVIDTSLNTADSIAPVGYVCKPLFVDGNVLGSVFDTIKVDLECSIGEQTCLYHMIHDQKTDLKSDLKPDLKSVTDLSGFTSTTIYSTIPTEKQNVQLAIEKLNHNITQIQVLYCTLHILYCILILHI